MQLTKLITAILTVFFLVSVFDCQLLRAEISPPPPLKGFGWRQSLPVHLLSEYAVRKDLGLTADSNQTVNASNSQINWNEVLTAEQKVRLDQIHLQRAKLVQALSDSSLIKELGGFTEQQQQAILAAHKRFHIIQESFPNKLRGSRVRYEKEEFRKIVADRMKENEKELTTKLMQVLTPEQSKKFEELKGKPLELPETERQPEK